MQNVVSLTSRRIASFSVARTLDGRRSRIAAALIGGEEPAFPPGGMLAIELS